MSVLPLNLLRRLQHQLRARQVTTFFITSLRWLLFPLNCAPRSPEDPDTISTWIRNDTSAPCTPWGALEVAVTLLSLLLAAVFILFSLATTLLSFEVSPISQVPADTFTGRVEAAWSTVRVTAVLMVFIQVASGVPFRVDCLRCS